MTSLSCFWPPVRPPASAWFGRLRLDALADLFTQTLHLAQKLGMVKMGRVALDGAELGRGWRSFGGVSISWLSRWPSGEGGCRGCGSHGRLSKQCWRRAGLVRCLGVGADATAQAGAEIGPVSGYGPAIGVVTVPRWVLGADAWVPPQVCRDVLEVPAGAGRPLRAEPIALVSGWQRRARFPRLGHDQRKPVPAEEITAVVSHASSTLPHGSACVAVMTPAASTIAGVPRARDALRPSSLSPDAASTSYGPPAP